MTETFDVLSFMREGVQETPENLHDEYLALKADILKHAERYYTQNESDISDYEYDQLMQKLQKMESEHPEWVAADSPSQVVGGSIQREAGIPVTHNIPMLSIRDVFSLQDVSDWVENIFEKYPVCDIHVEEKIDGLSMTVRYQGGKLVMAETRGDGYVGEDVTNNAYYIAGVPHEIRSNSPDDYLEVRGEVYMSRENFERYNEKMYAQGKPLAANARNLASGTLRQLNAAVVAERGLSFFAFSVQAASGAYSDIISSQGYGLSELKALGFTPVRDYFCSSTQEVVDAINRIGEMRESLAYDIDGAVVKIGNVARRTEFPSGNSKYEAGHIAFKYPPEEKEVVISSIDVGVGRTGKISFTAVFENPVLLAGTSVQRATVHNMDYIREKGIGIGARVICRKQGDIIPAVVRVVNEPKEVFMAPDVCPVCGEELFSETNVTDIYCVNPSCPAQLKNTLVYFCGRDAVDIKSLGESILSELVEQGYLSSYADIYGLCNYREKLIASGIIGRDKNTDKVLEAIENSKTKDASGFLTGLGIRNVGKTTAKQLLRTFGSIDALADASIEELLSIPDIGETTAACIRAYFSNAEHLRLLERARSAGVNFASLQETVSNKFSNAIFCITGTLSKPRAHFVSLVESFGGKVTGSVSKKTNYVIAGENAGSKLAKAKELGITVLSENEFEELI